MLTQNLGRNSETLTVGSTTLTLVIAGAGAPGVAYFNGGATVGSKTTWNNLSDPNFVNFSTNLAGTNDAGNVVGATSDVILNANNATANVGTSAITATLGASTIINSLRVNGNGTTTIGADGSTLTINALADSNTDTGGGFTGNTAGVGIVVGSTANAFTINVPVVLGGNQSWTNSSANLFTVAGTVTGQAATASTLTLADSSTGATTLSGVMANGAGGTLALVVNNTGAGVTTLSNSGNTYSGGTTLNGGTLTSAVAGGYGTGNVTINPTNATGTAADNATLNSTGSIAATAAVTVNTEASDGGFGIGTINFNSTAPTIGSLAGNGKVVLNNAGGTTLTIGSTNNLSGTFSGVISQGSGTGSIIKAGTGTETLSGANTYTGTTTINAGTLALGNSQGIGAATTASVIFGSGSTGKLQLNGNNLTVIDLNTNATVGTPIIESGSGTAGTDTLTVNTTNADTYAGVLQNGGTRLLALIKSGSGTLTLTGTNTYTGGTSVTGGTAVLGNVSGFGTGAVAVGSAGTVTIGLNNTIGNVFTGNGTVTVNTNGGNTQFSSATAFNGFTGTLNVNSTGGNKMVLNVAGQTLGSGATVNIANGATFFITTPTPFAGVTFNLSGGDNGEGLGALRLEGATIASSSAVNLLGNTSIGGNNNNSTINAVIAGTGFGFTKVGGNTLFLGGANTYSGTTSINGGTLNLSNALALQNSTLNYTNTTLAFDQSVTGNAFTLGGLSGTANLALQNNATTPAAVALTVGNNNSDQTYSGALSGAGSLTKTGTGTQTLSNANTFSGGATVNGGTLILTGANTYTGGTVINGGGTVQMSGSGTLGSTSGTLTVNGNGVAITDGVLDMNGTNQTVGNLNGTLGEIRGNALSGTVTLTVGSGNATGGNFQGSLQDGTVSGGGTLALTKVGTGTQTLSGNNSFATGATTIGTSAAGAGSQATSTSNGGTLVANGVNSLGGTAAIVVNNGGTLLLAGSGNIDRVNDSASLTLGTTGGSGAGQATLSLQGLSNSSETLGSLSLSSDSTLDFGTGSGNTLNFASLALNGHNLTVLDWTGNYYTATQSTDNGTSAQDRLLFQNDPTLNSNNLGSITFYNDAGGLIGTGKEVNFGGGGSYGFEIVPVPEPTTWFAALGLLGLVGYRERRRINVLFAKKAA